MPSQNQAPPGASPHLRSTTWLGFVLFSGIWIMRPGGTKVIEQGLGWRGLSISPFSRFTVWQIFHDQTDWRDSCRLYQPLHSQLGSPAAQKDRWRPLHSRLLRRWDRSLHPHSGRERSQWKGRAVGECPLVMDVGRYGMPIGHYRMDIGHYGGPLVITNGHWS